MAGYRVYQHEIHEPAKTLKLWVRNRKLVCSGCGRKVPDAYDSYGREVRDLPWPEYRTTVVVELYRVRCPDCGIKTEKQGVPSVGLKTCCFCRRRRSQRYQKTPLRCFSW